jgi:glycosyltransferase involved in cell wall biosynthesis
MVSQTKLSIVIPTYNRARLVRRAIESCLNNAPETVEVIVVDDASTDPTPEILAAVSDPRVRTFRLAENGGVCAARRFGVQQASGDWIGFLDSDDELVADGANRLLALFAEVPDDVGVLYGRCQHDGGRISPRAATSRGRLSFADYLARIEDLADSDAFTCVRKRVFERFNFPKERVYEMRFHLDVVEAFGAYTVPEPLSLVHCDAAERLTRASDVRSAKQDAELAAFYAGILERHGPALKAHSPLLWRTVAQRTLALDLGHGRRRDAMRTLGLAMRQGGMSARLLAIFLFGSLGSGPVNLMRKAGRAWR